MKYLIILAIILLFIGVSFGSDNSTKLVIYNPYSLGVKVEIKCDYNYKTKKFEFHKFMKVPGKKNTIISVPKNLNRCQIWPKIIW